MSVTLRRAIWALGAVEFLCFGVSASISYAFYLATPLGPAEPRKYDALRNALSGWPLLPPFVAETFAGSNPLARSSVLIVGYATPVIAASIAFLTLLALLFFGRRALSPSVPGELFKVAVLFVLPCMFSMPMLVPDFWFSVVWGREIAQGANPYYASPVFTAQDIAGVPIGGVADARMTYGPLWALISGGVMGLAGGDVWRGAVLFKLLLAGCWVGSLRLVWALLANRPVWHQALGLATFGWLPLSVLQAVADGHNDIVFLVPLLLWLWALQTHRPAAGLFALAGSVLVKYVSAPLALMHALYRLRSGRGVTRRDMFGGLAATGLVVLCFAPFYRSTEFFAGLGMLRGMELYTPADAMGGLGVLTGWDVGWAVIAVRWLSGLFAVWAMARYVWRPSEQAFRYAVLAVLYAALFAILQYAWPWYLLWPLALAATAPTSRLAQWTVGLTLAAPFPYLVRLAMPWLEVEWRFLVPSLALHCIALLWLAAICYGKRPAWAWQRRWARTLPHRANPVVVSGVD